MEKFFNTAGPVNPDDHYCLPLEVRLDVEENNRSVGNVNPAAYRREENNLNGIYTGYD